MLLNKDMNVKEYLIEKIKIIDPEKE